MSLAPSRVDYLTRLLARSPARAGPPTPPPPTSSPPSARSRSIEAASRPRSGRSPTRSAPSSWSADDEWPALATIQARLAGAGLNGRFLALPMYPTFAQQIASRDRAGQPSHLLAREDWYQSIRAAHLGDRIIPVVGNFAGPTTLPNLADWLTRPPPDRRHFLPLRRRVLPHPRRPVPHRSPPTSPASPGTKAPS